jgi:predicted permease
MSVLRRIAVKVRGLARAHASDAELDEELQSHLERDIARRVAEGVDPHEARLAARRQFGNPTLLAEEARESWRVGWLERLGQDVRYALRGFARAPGFVATVVLTIGLGLGLLTAAFTIFDTYALRAHAVRDPEGLYELWFHGREGRSRDASWSEYEAMRESNPSLGDVFAYRWAETRLDGQLLLVQAVTGNFFTGLGVTPSLGRVLIPSDARAPGGEQVLVLSHQTWTGRFGGDSSVIGRFIRLNGRAMQIVGVARAGFDGLTGLPPDFWIPITASVGLADDADIFGQRQPAVLRIIGRLRPGHTVEGARRALASWGALLTRERPEAERVVTVRLLSRATPVPMAPLLVQIVVPIAVAVLLVLLIACANVANVMLARGMARQREMGVRLALGAGRRRLIRQLFTESVILAITAAVVAFAFSRLALGAGLWALFASLPPAFTSYIRVLPLAPDWRVFVFIVLAALAAAVAFGLVPALQATRSSVVQATRGEFDTGFRPSRLRSFLVGAQVTVAVLLLVCAAVLLRGAQRVGTQDLGLRTAGTLELFVMDSARRVILDELRSHPDVVDIGAGSEGAISSGPFPVVAATGHPGSRTVASYVNGVTPNFFDMLGVELRQGRIFTVEEAERSLPVAIVSEAAARRFWPGGVAVGATLTLAGSDSTPARSVEVIGVSADVVPGSMLLGTDVPIVLLPTTVESRGLLVLRVRGDESRARVQIEQALQTRAPGGVTEFHTADEAVAMMVYPFQFGHWLATVLGIVALVLTASGIYGVVAYLVVQRTKEIGIRRALGASRARVVLVVARDLLRLTVVGVAVGTALALGVSRFFASQIVAFETFDALAYVGGIAVVVVACAAAAFIPSRRVAAVDPMIALRSE